MAGVQAPPGPAGLRGPAIGHQHRSKEEEVRESYLSDKETGVVCLLQIWEGGT